MTIHLADIEQVTGLDHVPPRPASARPVPTRQSAAGSVNGAPSHGIAHHGVASHGAQATQKGTARPGGAQVYARLAKRGLDLVLVLIALPIVLPLVAVLAALVALDGRMPFYVQPRLGRDGRRFTLWKLRTMVPDADALLEQHLAADPAARAEWAATQKLKDDPRVTWIGAVLRKTSLDELPQLWNVLVGEMSLVGPRPMMVSQRGLYPGQSYWGLRPGITGYWQVADRNQCDFSDRARFDDDYARDLSFGTDLSVLVRTVAVVLRGTGY